jgi:hypothetical protein
MKRREQHCWDHGLLRWKGILKDEAFMPIARMGGMTFESVNV